MQIEVAPAAKCAGVSCMSHALEVARITQSLAQRVKETRFRCGAAIVHFCGSLEMS